MLFSRIAVVFSCAAALAAVALINAAPAQDLVKLPAPEMRGGMPLMEALAQRRSIRAFKDQALSQQMLSNLLWAAYGINRPETGDHTVPSWRGSKEIDVYVATADGVSVYDPKANVLRRVMPGDIRKKTSSMVFVADAPLVLVYVADLSRMGKASEEEQVLNAHVDAGIVAQNVYLFAASSGLATVVLGSVDRKALAQTLGVRREQIVTFSQPVGYPK
jgi:SagB-type dehydrogenase family enzyme